MVAATEAPGCALEVKSRRALAKDVTITTRISRIIRTTAVECHRSGGLGPFSLATYDDLRRMRV